MSLARKVVKQGNSFWVSLPKDWCRLHGIKEGSLVEMEATNDGILIRIKK